MVLSILPMAAFAAEEEHTHNESCGCADVSVTAVCSHAVKTLVNSTAQYSTVTTSTYHFADYTDTYQCNSCGAFSTDVREDVMEEHVAKTIVRIDSGTENGDEYYVYQYTCACGYSWTKTVWSYDM
jgi:hypothetical protein